MEFVSTPEALRSLYKEPSEGSLRKELKRLDGHCRSFIARSPFVLIGSSDGDGNADVTPKGDRPGFVAVLDDTTIAVPDLATTGLIRSRIYSATRRSGCFS
jgi:predicted pyridoxine 5'-phosphate oxidase superfamily flavin-nucleotide-binding protein